MTLVAKAWIAPAQTTKNIRHLVAPPSSAGVHSQTTMSTKTVAITAVKATRRPTTSFFNRRPSSFVRVTAPLAFLCCNRIRSNADSDSSHSRKARSRSDSASLARERVWSSSASIREVTLATASSTTLRSSCSVSGSLNCFTNSCSTTIAATTFALSPSYLSSRLGAVTT